jgi:hypothetical protein
VLFSLIFLTTFRESVCTTLTPWPSSSRRSQLPFLCIPLVFSYIMSRIPRPNQLSSDSYHLVRLHIWPLDWCYYILLCGPQWRTDCIYSFPHISSQLYLPVALLRCHSQARRTRHRETSQTPLPHPPRTIPVQRDELPSCSVDHAHTQNVHRLHCSKFVQSDYSHKPGNLNYVPSLAYASL